MVQNIERKYQVWCESQSERLCRQCENERKYRVASRYYVVLVCGGHFLLRSAERVMSE